MKRQGLIRGNDAVDSNILRQMSDMAARIATLEKLLLTQDHANLLYLSIADASPTMHPAVSLDSDADTLLSLSTQELGLDVQADNTVFSGPVSGGPSVPEFRALEDADIPAAIARDSEVTAAIAAHAADEDAHHTNTGGGARIARTTDFTLPSSGFHDIIFDTALVDTFGSYDSDDPERITILEDGNYNVSCNVTSDATVLWRIVASNAGVIAEGYASNNRLNLFVGMVPLDATEYIVLKASQSTGSDITLTASSISMLLAVEKVGG